jgi:hypothetical protein
VCAASICAVACHAVTYTNHLTRQHSSRCLASPAPRAIPAESGAGPGPVRACAAWPHQTTRYAYAYVEAGHPQVCARTHPEVRFHCC